MDTGANNSYEGRITRSHLYALNNGAVITTPIILTDTLHLNFSLKPGDEIDMQTPDPDHRFIRCRILDIESIHAEPDNSYIRLTLEKA
jgi:hypothetical protein